MQNTLGVGVVSPIFLWSAPKLCIGTLLFLIYIDGLSRPLSQMKLLYHMLWFYIVQYTPMKITGYCNRTLLQHGVMITTFNL